MTAPHDDGRGYRDVIAEMRWDMAEQVTVSFRNRAPRWMSAWYKDARRLRATIRRIRALDAVVELAAVGEQARHDLALDLQETVRAAQERVPIESACAGLTAVWCPVHGDCECPRNAAGERSLDGLDCPLHSYSSQHAMPEPQP